jgi:hypothetical protein
MELLQFVFSSFWVWLGCVVLIVAAGEAVATAAAGDKLVREYETTFINGGLRLKPLKTNNGVMFIRSLYLSPLEDVIDEELSYQCRHFLNTRSAFTTPAAEDEEEPDENQTTTFDAEAAEDTE